MSSSYAVTHQTAAGTDLPMINLTGSAAIRCALYEIILGASGTPQDQSGIFVLERTTDAGTGGTTLTEEPLDPLTVAATGAAVGGTFGVVPTDGNELLQIALHQRATFRWVATPGKELISAAASANGLMLNCESYSSGTPNIESTFHWTE